MPKFLNSKDYVKLIFVLCGCPTALLCEDHCTNFTLCEDHCTNFTLCEDHCTNFTFM